MDSCSVAHYFDCALCQTSIAEAGAEGLGHNTPGCLHLGKLRDLVWCTEENCAAQRRASTLDSHPSPCSISWRTDEEKAVGFAGTSFWTNGVDADGRFAVHAMPGNHDLKLPIGRMSKSALQSWLTTGHGEGDLRFSSPVFYFHPHCFRMCARFLSFPYSESIRYGRPIDYRDSSSLHKLYNCLLLRWQCTLRPAWHYTFPSVFEALGPCFNLGNLGNGGRMRGMLAWHKADPQVPLPSLPQWLLSKLKRDDDGQDGCCSHTTASDDVKLPQHGDFSLDASRPLHSSPFTALPYDILHQISTYVPRPSLFALRLTCTALASSFPLTSFFWRDAFLGPSDEPPTSRKAADLAASPTKRFYSSSNLGDVVSTTHATPLFGFMFRFPRPCGMMHDLRSRCAKGKGKGDARIWDWKGLVRELAREENFEDGGVFDDAPAGFRNRRRLWRMLEDVMREGKTMRWDWLRDMRSSKRERPGWRQEQAVSSQAAVDELTVQHEEFSDVE